MDSVKFKLDTNYGDYSSRISTPGDMYILANFLAIDVGLYDAMFFKKWALADKEDPHSEFNYNIGGDTTWLEEDGNEKIHLVDNTGSDEDDEFYMAICFTITKKQFIQLLDDWQEKVCKRMPKEVIIREENGIFTIETTDSI